MKQGEERKGKEKKGKEKKGKEGKGGIERKRRNRKGNKGNRIKVGIRGNGKNDEKVERHK